MAEEDIYGNKKHYERFKQELDSYTRPYNPKTEKHKRRYYIKNPSNLKYFKSFFEKFDARDTSYPRRMRLIRSLLLIGNSTDKDLSDCDRQEIDHIVAFMHTTYKSAKSKSDFIKDIRFIWKTLLPEKDIQGRPDETIVPYPVRHLSPKIDRSKEKLKGDRLSLDDFERIVSYFSDEPCIQAYLTLSMESLGRPQETLYIRIKDVELYDNYSKIWIAQHGKEGTGFLQCIDSHPYLVKWYNQHPFKRNPNAYLFLNSINEQLKPPAINKAIRKALKKLKIQTHITCYSLKRNGVTYRRLRGDSDMTIQHVARWTSTRQLKTYDKSTQEDAFKLELIKRGMIKPDKDTPGASKKSLLSKKCLFCGNTCGFSEVTCQKCLRPLDREEIRRQEEAKENQLNNATEQYNELRKQIEANSRGLKEVQEFLKHEAVQKLFKTIIKIQKKAVS